jgi:membrane-bound lytic murein transglycosylase MltF
MRRYLGYLGSVSIRISRIILASILLTSSDVRAELLDDVGIGLDPVKECGLLLMREAGKTGPEVDALSDLYSRASTDKDVEFRLYMMGVIYTESRFDHKAVSTAAAHGLMQMTELAIIDAAKHCSLQPVGIDNMFDSYTNVQYGTCYLAKLLQQTGGDWDRALVAYNGGYAQLQRFDRGLNIAGETANYVLKVKRAVKFCLQKQ